MMELRMVSVLRRRLATLPLQLANPVWVQDKVDYAWHIRRVRLPKPGSWAQLEATVAELHAELLDRSRPLWRLYVLEGLASGEQAYYFKVHHAMLDGQAGVALAGAMFSTSPEPLPARMPARRRPAAEQPGTLALAAAAFRHDAAQYVKLVRELPGVVRTLSAIVKNSVGNSLASPMVGAGKARDAASLAELRRSASFGPRTPFNVAITPERGFATAVLPRAELKAIAAAADASVNDVVMSLCSGALRRWLKRNAALPRKSLIASMPISLREQGNTEMRTQATLSLVSLASNVADPLARLRAIRDSAGATKAVARQAKSVIPTDIPLLGVPWLVGALAALYGRRSVVDRLPILANVLISNVPGPPVPLYVDGLRMTGYWPLSIVEHGIGVNITLMSYAGNLCFGFVVAKNAVPEAAELAQDLLAAWDELKVAVSRAPTSKPAAPRRPRTRKAS
jgi:WS/DGAT/MGAT family acyltransferase